MSLGNQIELRNIIWYIILEAVSECFSQTFSQKGSLYREEFLLSLPKLWFAVPERATWEPTRGIVGTAGAHTELSSWANTPLECKQGEEHDGRRRGVCRIILM